MTTQKLTELLALLNDFAASDIFGLSEMHELTQVNQVIELVEGAIINQEEEE